MNVKVSKKQNIETQLSSEYRNLPKEKITHHFIGDESLEKILISVFEIQVG